MVMTWGALFIFADFAGRLSWLAARFFVGRRPPLCWSAARLSLGRAPASWSAARRFVGRRPSLRWSAPVASLVGRPFLCWSAPVSLVGPAAGRPPLLVGHPSLCWPAKRGGRPDARLSWPAACHFASRPPVALLVAARRRPSVSWSAALRRAGRRISAVGKNAVPSRLRLRWLLSRSRRSGVTFPARISGVSFGSARRSLLPLWSW